MSDAERGPGIRLVPKPRHRRVQDPADIDAFLSAAGTWRDVDTDALVRDIVESRRLSSRPPVEL